MVKSFGCGWSGLLMDMLSRDEFQIFGSQRGKVCRDDDDAKRPT